MRRPTAALVTAFAALVAAPSLVACSSAAGSPEPTATATPAATAVPDLVLTSPDLAADGTLPAWASGRYSSVCQGENRSPTLSWEGGPDEVASYVLTLTDPAHPQYVHWVVTGIPGGTRGLDQAEEGAIDVGVVGSSYRGGGMYAGPCVPGNTYVYTLYALDTEVVGDAATSLDAALALTEGHVLDEATLEVVPSPG
ncbi:YbhB/YbcL family Raf kinase inhibitor-like protein [Cellulomonas palmilytica]|uniref:YbhB/YbcL family Raf kinase inhibitor-like protein n=1 Tax=Cellulomonas palmilytica TaxID=2608402 RepID=UPI001F439699|nr:YbhB/YbcL family Raf kinase inhibitor-like protein [Cellulomonas palmilytica]UJP40436.1 YbhB/YbcL family Raf kinase inhibitor-like protein [Cellulomonas palmilytica]